MDISNPHNLVSQPPPEGELRFGIRVSPQATDPFRRLVDAGWSNVQWFATRRARDAAILDMGKRHPFNRIGDKPTIVLEPVEREAP